MESHDEFRVAQRRRGVDKGCKEKQRKSGELRGFALQRI